MVFYIEPTLCSFQGRPWKVLTVTNACEYRNKSLFEMLPKSASTLDCDQFWLVFGIFVSLNALDIHWTITSIQN